MNKNIHKVAIDALAQNKKKILYIVEAMGGGVFTYIVDLSNELVNEYDIYIAYAVRPQTPKNYRDYFDKRIHLIEVKNFGRAISLTKDFKAFAEVRSIAKRVKPDIIHLHSSKAGALGRVALNGRKTPIFYTPHGYSFLMENYKPMKRRLFKLIEWVCAKFNCTTISCSKGEHQETLKLTKRAEYVNNGVNIKDLQALIDATEVSTEYSFTVFTLGRINYQKNPELFNKVAEALPEVRFCWIGDGELREYLKSENIEITGWVERTEALKYSIPADVFLLTSSWEGLPISLLEAMYMKKPCIVSNVIGNRDVIKNDVNGFICDKAEDYVAAIKKCREEMCRDDIGKCADNAHPESKTQLNGDVLSNGVVHQIVERAYTDILSEYNTKAMAEKYSQIYKRALKYFEAGVGGVHYEVVIIFSETIYADRNIINNPSLEEIPFTQIAYRKAVA